MKIVLLLCAVLMATTVSMAATYALPPQGEDLVGEPNWTVVAPEETLADLALRHDIGFRQLLQANPGTDPWLPASDAPVLLPQQLVLPRSQRRGIVINLAEMRLYHFPSDRQEVRVYPVGIGRDGWESPLGLTRIRQKVRDPVWRPTASIRAEHEADGDPLPEEVPPGPDNPLGPLALRLDLPSVLIHGSNRPYSIGMPVTHGCIRMSADDIRELFDSVAVGTPVMVIDEPYKLGRSKGAWYLEAHAGGDSDAGRVRQLMQQAGIAALDWNAVTRILGQPLGVPVAVGNPPGVADSTPDYSLIRPPGTPSGMPGGR